MGVQEPVYAKTIRLKGRTIIVTTPMRPVSESNNKRRKRHAIWRKGERYCFRCGGGLTGPDNCTLEHKVPRADGGANTLASGNLGLSHHKCNTLHGGAISERIRSARWLARPWWERAGLRILWTFYRARTEVRRRARYWWWRITA